MFIPRKCDAKEHRCDGIKSHVTSCSLIHMYTKFQRNVLSKSLGTLKMEAADSSKTLVPM